MNTVHKVLIIDEDETTCFLNRCFLEDMQVTNDIVCFYDASEALVFIKKLCDEGSFEERGPDLIFSPGDPTVGRCRRHQYARYGRAVRRRGSNFWKR